MRICQKPLNVPELMENNPKNSVLVSRCASAKNNRGVEE